MRPRAHRHEWEAGESELLLAGSWALLKGTESVSSAQKTKKMGKETPQQDGGSKNRKRGSDADSVAPGGRLGRSRVRADPDAEAKTLPRKTQVTPSSADEGLSLRGCGIVPSQAQSPRPHAPRCWAPGEAGLRRFCEPAHGRNVFSKPAENSDTRTQTHKHRALAAILSKEAESPGTGMSQVQRAQRRKHPMAGSRLSASLRCPT